MKKANFANQLVQQEATISGRVADMSSFLHPSPANPTPGVTAPSSPSSPSSKTKNPLSPESLIDLDEPLPAYTETQYHTETAGPSSSLTANNVSHPPSLYNPEAPPPPFSPYVAETSHHYSHCSIISFDPHLNTDGEALYRFLLEQAKFPPRLSVRIRGTHSERVRSSDNNMRDEMVTDFDFCLDLSGCLFEVVMRDEVNGGKLTVVEDHEEVQRGSVFKRKMCDNRREGVRGFERGNANREDASGFLPVHVHEDSISGDLEGSLGNHASKRTIRDWADDYCASRAFLKSFTVTKTISNINHNLIKQELTSIVRSTNYRGRIHISFIKKQHKIIIYPDNTISRWRMNTYIRWFFYLTFLWIITWPILFFMTKKWNVVKSNWTFGFIVGRTLGDFHHTEGVPVVIGDFPINPNPDNIKPEAGVSERYFCKVWAKAIKYAAHGRKLGATYLTGDDWREAETEERLLLGLRMAGSEQPVWFDDYREDHIGLVGGFWRMARRAMAWGRGPASRRMINERWGWGTDEY